MESYIQISKINDFLYSPQSLYLHSVYESFDTDIYHEEPQKVGKLNHENIDEGKYSTAKRYIQGLSVYSEKYNLVGKIDIYDTVKKELCERKTFISNIYDGHRFQLFAQMFAMQEMGYEVKSLSIQSLQNNRRHHIDIPDKHDIAYFEKTLQKIRDYDATEVDASVYRCNLSIYRHLSY